MQDFRKLKVWVRANDLAPRVRSLTQAFPKPGYSSLRDQIIDATESIPFNIAEGAGAASPKEFARFLDIGIKSTCELEAELYLVLKYKIVVESAVTSCSNEAVEIRRMIWGLRARVLKPSP